MSEKITGRLKKALGAEFDNVRSGIIYGSRKPGRDVDILLVFGSTPSGKQILYEDLDISMVSADDLAHRVQNWDPEYTEPLLTGEVFHGDKQLTKDLEAYLKSHVPDGEVLEYLSKRSLETYSQSETMLSDWRYKFFVESVNSGKNSGDAARIVLGDDIRVSSPHLFGPLSVLSYSLGYLAFKLRYENSRQYPITLGHILLSPGSDTELLLKRLETYIKDKRPDGRDISLADIDNYFRASKGMLRKKLIHRRTNNKQ